MKHYFNHVGRLVDREQAGEIVMHVSSSGRAPGRAAQGRGARSQEVEYMEAGRLIAICHRYLRRDGTIGGRDGRPDPKWLLVGDEIWLPEHNDHGACNECPNWGHAAPN